MKLEILISALEAEPRNLIKKMKLSSDAVLVNQCTVNSEEEIEIKGGTVKVISNTDRGVGNSRNLALKNSSCDIILFGDDDIVYTDGYSELILNEFEKHPEADGIFFNVEVDESRRTYYNEEFAQVTLRSSGRFPTYSLALRRQQAIDGSLSFSPLFGGGARYSCGEDSLFIMDCLKAGLRLYKSPICIGREELRPSTWFEGYTEKYFFDKGVLYPFLYGILAAPVALRFLLKHRDTVLTGVSMAKAYKLMLSGINEGKKIKKENT